MLFECVPEPDGEIVPVPLGDTVTDVETVPVPETVADGEPDGEPEGEPEMDVETVPVLE